MRTVYIEGVPLQKNYPGHYYMQWKGRTLTIISHGIYLWKAFEQGHAMIATAPTLPELVERIKEHEQSKQG